MSAYFKTIEALLKHSNSKDKSQYFLWTFKKANSKHSLLIAK